MYFLSIKLSFLKDLVIMNVALRWLWQALQFSKIVWAFIFKYFGQED
jgi:hypothetical protein